MIGEPDFMLIRPYFRDYAQLLNQKRASEKVVRGCGNGDQARPLKRWCSMVHELLEIPKGAPTLPTRFWLIRPGERPRMVKKVPKPLDAVGTVADGDALHVVTHYVEDCETGEAIPIRRGLDLLAPASTQDLVTHPCD